MPNLIDINTGEVKIGQGKQTLTCRAIGSCIALVLVDMEKPIGGIAHIMLPGQAPKNSEHPNRYAQNAIEELIYQLSSAYSSFRLIAALVGAGNVLCRKDDTICHSNINSVTEILNKYSIPIVESSIGGYERRSVTFFAENGRVLYTMGDSKEQLLLNCRSIGDIIK